MKKKVILGICGVLAVAAVAAGSIAIGTSSHEYELGASMKDVPDGKIMAKVDGEPIDQKDVLYQLEQQKLEKKNNCLSIEKMKNDDLQTAKEMLASFDPLIDSDKEALDLCIRGKVILKECEKLGILPTIEECIKEQQQIYQDVKARMKSDVDIERVTAQYAYQFFHDTAQGYGITDDEMIKTHSAKSYQLFKSSGNLYEYFLANVYKGEQSDADSVKQAYEQYFDQLKSSHKVEYLVKLRTKKNTVPGLVIPSVPDTASSPTTSVGSGQSAPGNQAASATALPETTPEGSRQSMQQYRIVSETMKQKGL